MLTAVQPPGRCGAFTLRNDTLIHKFHENNACDGAWVNSGYFVLESKFIDYIDGDDTVC